MFLHKAGKICSLMLRIGRQHNPVAKGFAMIETKLRENSLVALLILGVVVVVMASSEIYGRASIGFEGVISSREIVCQQPKNNRCVTNYILKAVPDGTQLAYEAGPTVRALSSDMPVGALVKKDRWKLAYEVNGHVLDDFPAPLFAGLLAIGFTAIGIWAFKRFLTSTE